MKRILIASHFFYPTNTPRSFRAFELSRELYNQGYFVDVLIGSKKKVVNNFNPLNWIKENENNIDIKEDVSPKLFRNKYFKAFVTYFFGEKYFLTHYPKVRKLININDYDGIVSIGLPFYVHYAISKKLKLNKKSISICDWGDPFVTPKPKLAGYWGKIQKNVINSFDYITVPIEGAKDYYTKYCDLKKIKIIPQGYNFNDIEICDYCENKIPTFAYAGNFYEDIRNPNNFFKYLMTLDREFKFIVFTNKNSRYYCDYFHKYEAALAQKLVVNNTVPRKECIKELSKADFLVNINNTVSIQAPSKLIDYSLTKRPIFSFTQDNIQKEQFSCFLNGNYKYALSFDNSAYNIKNVAEAFIKLFE